MTTSRRLLIGGLIVVGATAYMAYVGASASWQYYLTVDECAADPSAFLGSRLRVSGKVAPGSVHAGPGGAETAFTLQGSGRTLQVCCRGPLPDGFKEDIDVVVEGRLEADGLLQGEKVLTRCASKYQSSKPPAGPGRDGAEPGR